MRKIHKLKFRIYLMVTLTYIVVGLLGLLLFYAVTPQKYFGVFPSIGLFFWVSGMALTYFLDRNRVCRTTKMLNVFMWFRMIKLFALIGFLIIGLSVAGLHRATFVISLMSNYFIYSGLEIYIYYRFNKRVCGK